MHKEAIDGLKKQLRGPIIARGDASYDAARAVYNGMIGKRPLLIAQCAEAADVMTALSFERNKSPSAEGATTARVSAA
jgi:hypothetical protein